MGKNLKSYTYGVILLAFLLAYSPLASAAESPPSCMAYAYTYDGGEGHFSLVASDTFVFGTHMEIISNCDENKLHLDGILVASSNGTIRYNVPAGIHNISITNPGVNLSFQNVHFLSTGALGIAMDNLPAEHHPEAVLYSPADIGNMEMFAGIGSIIISWLMVVGILWKLINNHQDRNFCQEVK